MHQIPRPVGRWRYLSVLATLKVVELCYESRFNVTRSVFPRRETVGWKGGFSKWFVDSSNLWLKRHCLVQSCLFLKMVVMKWLIIIVFQRFWGKVDEQCIANLERYIWTDQVVYEFNPQCIGSWVLVHPGWCRFLPSVGLLCWRNKLKQWRFKAVNYQSMSLNCFCLKWCQMFSVNIQIFWHFADCFEWVWNIGYKFAPKVVLSQN